MKSILIDCHSISVMGRPCSSPWGWNVLALFIWHFMKCRMLLCLWPWMATSMIVRYNLRSWIGYSDQLPDVHGQLGFWPAIFLFGIHPSGCIWHPVWADFLSRLALCISQTSDAPLGVPVSWHIWYLYNTHPSAPFSDSVFLRHILKEGFHHC